MVVATEQMSLNHVLHGFNQIIIPDVQRDYVMGSGEEKLLKLLTAMAESNGKKENFSFSCLVGYKDENNNLYIYDGQQRLATLVCLCSYLTNETDVEIKNLLKKFSFTNRVVANDWLSNPTMINETDAVDFTTYSLAQLIKVFNTQHFRINYTNHKFSDKITFDFLFNRVIFNTIFVNEISDAEQFFLDINDGLDLKSYELYKAELYHHAAGMLNKEEFKRFSLKMENEWLKNFIPFRYEEIGKNGNIYCEEEMLVFFLQYCFRMIWIEERGNAEGYESVNVKWLRKEYLQRVEQIIDALIDEIESNCNCVGNATCINYSDPYKYFSTRGQHWSISDTNYNAMLEVFLKNVHKKNEINKDVIIWCYISNLPVFNQDKNILYKYLRFLKKLLNNNREENNNAKILFCGWGIKSKKVAYSRYYVKGIPEYYIGHKIYCDEDTVNFFNMLIVLNKEYTLNSEENFVDVYLRECKADLLKDILERERQKQNSLQKELIEKYENLVFINGLVDKLLNYSDGICYLNSLYDENLYTTISTGEFLEDKYQYKDILKFISKNNIDISDIVFSDVDISWVNYNYNYTSQQGTIHRSKGSLIPHTWCDFFTSDKGIIMNQGSVNDCLEYLAGLPDGWINGQKIIQPEDNIHTQNKKRGFASNSLTHVVWDMGDFINNFSWISKGKHRKYIINGNGTDFLPFYLMQYNGDSWVTNKLSDTEKVFFSKDLNELLLYRYKMFREKTGEDMSSYLKENSNSMQFTKMYNNKFFIELQEIYVDLNNILI